MKKSDHLQEKLDISEKQNTIATSHKVVSTQQPSLLRKILSASLLTGVFVIVAFIVNALFQYQVFKYHEFKFNQQYSAPSPTPLLYPIPKEVAHSTLFFLDKSKIYRRNGLENSTEWIALASDFDLSPDRSKIAYVNMDADNNIYIYGVYSHKTTVIPTDAERLRSVTWSPDGNYFVADSGTDSVESISIYALSTSKKIIEFTARTTLLGIGAWVSDKEFVYVEPHNLTKHRPWDGGQNSSVAKITLPDARKEVLLRASAHENYALTATQDNIIYFTKSTVKNTIDWESSDAVEKTSWQMNSDGTEIKPSQAPEPFHKTIERLLPGLPATILDDEVYDPILHPHNPDWVIFSWSQYSQLASKDAIYVLNLKDAQASLTKIVDGRQPAW